MSPIQRKFKTALKSFPCIRVCALFLAMALGAGAAETIRFHTDKQGYVSLNLYRADGKSVRQILTGKRFPAGDHVVPLEGAPLPPGDYKWSGVIHDGLTLRLRGWVGDWGGDLGPPSAAAADDDKVFLGWSLASTVGDSVVACDADGKIAWRHHRGALSGCHALAVDAGILFVLGGEGADAEGGAIYKLNTRDGSRIRWPDGSTDLKITSLWPADQKESPAQADFMSVKNGRIYLSFTLGNFIAILDAKTGAYLQTIVGSPPGAIDSAGTKCDTPDKPNVLVDADFLTLALKGGEIGKMLLVHDPIWVIASEHTPMDQNQEITSLTMIGDGAKHHMHHVFIGFGPPFHQVQARSVLNTEVPTYAAGKEGGRPPQGPWQNDRMSFIRATALDAEGKMWVAEGDATPRRISVWTTDAKEGKFAREYFAPPGSTSPAAIHPLDPHVMIAGGCEWKIDPQTGRASCLGVASHAPVRAMRFAVENGHVSLVLTPFNSPEITLDRMGDGDYKPRTGPAPAATPQALQLLPGPDGSWQLTTAEGHMVAALFGKNGMKPRTTIPPPPGDDWARLPDAAGTPTLAQMPDGRVFITAGRSRIWNLELTGIDTLRPIAGGKITVPANVH